MTVTKQRQRSRAERLGRRVRCSDRGCARFVSAAASSLRELARRLELSPSSISQIETGKMQPSVRTLYAFVSEFGVTVDEVLFDRAAPAGDGVRRRSPSSSPPWPGRASRCSARTGGRRSR